MIICPHCSLFEAPQYSGLKRNAGCFFFCGRCEGISIYEEVSRKRGHEMILRRATLAEYGTIRATPEMMLLRRLRKHYQNNWK